MKRQYPRYVTTVSFMFFAVIGLLLAGCAPTQQPPTQEPSTYVPVQSFDPAEEIQPQQFQSEEELLSFIRNHETSTSYFMRGGIAFDAVAQSAPSVAGGDSKVAREESAGSSYSQTNNQVAAVDEADIIKTDGEYIYTVSGTTLFVVKAYPGADAEVVSRIELDQQPTGLFIQGDNLVVFGNFYDTEYFSEINFRPRSGMTYLNVYNVADKAAPSLVKEYKFEGSYYQARMHNNQVYFVVLSSPEYRTDYPMPIIFEGNVKRSVAISDVYYFPVPYDNVQFASVHSIDLDNPQESARSVTVAVEGASTLYMSENNIYIAATQYVNEWEIRQEITNELVRPRLSEQDTRLISKIEATDEDVLSPNEKKAKINAIIQEHVSYLPSKEQQTLNDEIDTQLKEKLEKFESLEYTVISRLAVDDGAVSLAATGTVPGRLNNQFSMDEYNDVLRVATTLSPRWNSWIRPMAEPAVTVDIAEETDKRSMIAPPSQNSESSNNVYTLNMDMEVLDRLEGIAKGEQIFSTRFIGERLYMVTFRQVDPFFVVDLSDANNIAVLGELKIPGFSRYLHPYDENTVIGIGRDATDLGRQQGIKISLFDVTDVSKPTEIAHWSDEDEYSQSTAEWEHKAFLFDREKELLVIPGYSYDWSKTSGQQKYNGAMVFRINKEEIELRGIVDHGAGKTDYWGSLMERSLYIEDLLYTKSPGMLRINELEDLSSVKNVTLEGKNASPYPIY
jgi:inhibitor of cysteine peptidase